MTTATQAQHSRAPLSPVSDRSSTAPDDSRGRYDVLDAVRGIAVLAMVAVHFIGPEGGTSALGRGLTRAGHGDLLGHRSSAHHRVVPTSHARTIRGSRTAFPPLNEAVLGILHFADIREAARLEDANGCVVPW